MAHFVLIYELADDYLSRRPEFRGVHLALAQAAVARGELLLGGALTDPVDRAMLLFVGNDPSAAADFARSDPYVVNGLVTKWTVRLWTTVVGKDAVFPI